LTILTAPAGQQCGTRPCWSPTVKGYKLRSVRPAYDGLSPITLAAGLAGKGKIYITGWGPVRLPQLPVPIPVTVRLKRSESAECWDATFSAPLVNTQSEFRGTAD